MIRSSAILLVVASVLFGMSVLAASMDHRSYLELCVCVVNALTRGAIAVSVSIFFGCTVFIVDGIFPGRSRILGALFLIQIFAILVGIFFLNQYVLYLLEVISSS